VTAIKFLIALQSMIDLVLKMIIEKRDKDGQEALRVAIEEARGAKTDDEKRAAAKKISDAFRS
jgi:hypothetical protein